MIVMMMAGDEMVIEIGGAMVIIMIGEEIMTSQSVNGDKENVEEGNSCAREDTTLLQCALNNLKVLSKAFDMRLDLLHFDIISYYFAV